MDTARFDTLPRSLHDGRSRRALLGALTRSAGFFANSSTLTADSRACLRPLQGQLRRSWRRVSQEASAPLLHVCRAEPLRRHAAETRDDVLLDR